MTGQRDAAALVVMPKPRAMPKPMTGENGLGLSSRQRAGLQRLVDRGVLTPDQAELVRGELDPERAADARRGGGLWEVLGYVGGALVLGGASLVVGMSWDDLARAARVALLAAATLALIGTGVGIAGGPREVRAFADREPSPRTRITGVLFVLASCTAALAVGSAVHVDGSLPATATGLLVAVLGYAATRGLPALVAALGFSVGVCLAAVYEWFAVTTTPLTVGLVALGALWAGLATAGALRHRRAALGGGVLIALVGAQQPVGTGQPWWGYGLTLLIAVLCFGAYLYARSPVLLALGVLGVTVAVPEAVWDWTDGALSGPVTVLLVGVVFLAASAAGWRLRRTRER